MDPNHKRYLQEFSNSPTISFLEMDAVRIALNDLERTGKVVDLFQRMASSEKSRILQMIPQTADPLFQPIMVSLKYWRYVNRKTHPAYEKVNVLLANALARQSFTPDELKLAQEIVAEERSRLGLGMGSTT